MKVKFRCWDKVNKKMVYSPASADCRISITIPNLIEIRKKDGSGYIIGTTCLDERFDIMLYTQVKDKDDEEIYEGDIIRFKLHNDDNDYYIGAVYFSPIFSAFCVRWKLKMLMLSEVRDKKVIGDIYSHELSLSDIEDPEKDITDELSKVNYPD